MPQLFLGSLYAGFFYACRKREQPMGLIEMAGRKIGTRHQDDIRQKIQATQIINRFMSAFNGEVELTAVQVNIGKALLDKTLPNLQATEISGNEDNPLVHRIERVIVDADSTDTNT